ncbi:MAG: hypothetical protein IJ673_01970 [Treponema sp.]|nr:hypothetical protein [Treponema sp.]
MKKFRNVFLAFAAISALSLAFVSCSDSDDDSTSDTTQDPTNPQNPSENVATIDAAWDFKSGANASQNATILGYGTTATKPTSEITIDADSGSGATLVLLVQTGCSVKYNTGLQWGTGSKETEVMKITADDACTLTVKGKGASGDTFSTAKPNSFSVNGTSVYARTEASDKDEQEWTVSLNKGDNTIAVSGMKFISFSVAK